MSLLLHQRRIQNMVNYSKMEEFLFKAEQDLPGDIVLYRINRDGE